MAIKKIHKNGEYLGKREPLSMLTGMQISISADTGNLHEVFERERQMGWRKKGLDIYVKELKSSYSRDNYKIISIVRLFLITTLQNQPRFPTKDK